MRSKEIASNFWVWRYFFFDVGNRAGRPGSSAALRRPQLAGPGRAGRQLGLAVWWIRPRPWAQRSPPAAISLPAREQLAAARAYQARDQAGPGRSAALRRPPGCRPGQSRAAARPCRVVDQAPALGAALPSGGASLPAREQPVTAWALPGERSGRPPWEQRRSPEASACRPGSSWAAARAYQAGDQATALGTALPSGGISLPARE